ncbi:Enoyl-CoA hydratase/isomerase (plasmid) [Rhizobium leguminosarum bv. trifolii WSM2304]|uniref:Enoyl-CoA hydratase/isomerase n=1 Tax=Rhizobium leguminosarum bv. trifolii (strain WSM2304) TaxID=395492 RepID=A0ABF7QZV2_RHILW|nr:enoyl-CoA hydratase/isomerase family protein [Rhizobium leguminosarum]ACI59701.1 Enoyl-CoA hydratase/isomerase [Rhizobium leguminosarum bv. trifolii WSM2304]
MHIQKIIDDGTLWLTLSNPEQMNCLGLAEYNGLADAIIEASADDSLDVIAITGSGRAFCTGGNLKEIQAEQAKGELPGKLVVQKFADASLRLFQSMESTSKTVVAIVNGHCHAGGLSIVLSADISLASDRADFCIPEAKVGLADPYAPLRLGRAVGLPMARWMMYTADRITATKALEISLVNKVVPHDTLAEQARSLVRQVQRTAPTSRAIFKRCLNTDLPAFNREAMIAANASPDAVEGLKAFVARRDPVWPSRPLRANKPNINP